MPDSVWADASCSDASAVVRESPPAAIAQLDRASVYGSGGQGPVNHRSYSSDLLPGDRFEFGGYGYTIVGRHRNGLGWRLAGGPITWLLDSSIDIFAEADRLHFLPRESTGTPAPAPGQRWMNDGRILDVIGAEVEERRPPRLIVRREDGATYSWLPEYVNEPGARYLGPTASPSPTTPDAAARPALPDPPRAAASGARLPVGRHRPQDFSSVDRSLTSSEWSADVSFWLDRHRIGREYRARPFVPAVDEYDLLPDVRR